MNFNCRRFFLIYCILFPFVSIFSQTKAKDIDVLYQKYKNLDKIEITNAKGSILVNVQIALNNSGKPHSIILKGYITNYEVASSILYKLESDKINAGYTSSGLAKTYSDEIVSVSVYNKGNEYAKYGLKIQEFKSTFTRDKLLDGSYNSEENQKKELENYKNHLSRPYFIYMEVGDISRQLNGKGEVFKF